MASDPFERIAAPTDRYRRRLLINFAAVAGSAALTRVSGGQLASALEVPPAAVIPRVMAPDASRQFHAVTERLLTVMEEYRVPGAALGILANGREEHAAVGVVSLETNAPVTASTRFQIGSLTKTYTASAIMRLIDQGKLDLDATVRTYLPNLRLLDEDVAARVTVRHLLTHTSGWWGDEFSDNGDDDDAIARYVTERLPTLPQLAPLGAFFSYNNTGFTLLGRVIEVVTGQTYRAAVQDLVLDPLAMTESSFAREQIEQQPHAMGHGGNPQQTHVVTPLYLPRNLDAAGALWSTTRDQLRYARFHLGDGTAPDGSRLLTPHTLGLMRAPQVAIPGGRALSMGLPWFVQDLPGLRLADHGGDTFGQQTTFLFAPWHGFALVLFVNAEPANEVGSAVVNEAVQRYLGLDRDSAQAGGMSAALAAPAGTPTIMMPADELAQYTGRYSTPDSAVVLRVQNGRLLLSVEKTLKPEQIDSSIMPPPVQEVPLPFLAADVAILEGSVLPFIRRPNGNIGWMQLGLRLLPRSERP